MNKIVIIGSGGSGKSTTAVKLGEITGLPVIHLDSYFWKPGWVQVSHDEWLLKVKKLCAEPCWIMDGNYSGTMEDRFKEADIIIFLYFPRLICIWGIIKRRFTKRVDVIEGCPENISFEFFKWVWNYNKRKAPVTLQKLSKFKDKEIHILRNRKQLELLMEKIKSRHLDIQSAGI